MALTLESPSFDNGRHNEDRRPEVELSSNSSVLPSFPWLSLTRA